MSETGGTALTAAENYLTRGWFSVSIPHRTKFSPIDGWQNLRIGPGELDAHFNGQPQNIGVLPGAPSGGLVDVDLDSVHAVQLGPRFLPKTDAVFGRRSKPRSHWLYLRGHAIASQSAGRLRALLSLAESEAGIPVVVDDLDRDVWRFNIQNGTIDLRTGAFRGHNQIDLITKVSPVEYDPERSPSSGLRFSTASWPATPS